MRRTPSPCDALRVLRAVVRDRLTIWISGGSWRISGVLLVLRVEHCCVALVGQPCRGCAGHSASVVGSPSRGRGLPVRSVIGLVVASVRCVRLWSSILSVRVWCARGRMRRGAPVARLAAACLVAAVPRPLCDLIVPVPAASSRAAWRGVDGPSDLVRLLGRAWMLPTAGDALRRINDRPQRGLSADQRRRNAADAFAAAHVVTGRVLLVDDVMTTGATLRAAAWLLCQSGAERVDVVTFARVVTRL